MRIFLVIVAVVLLNGCRNEAQPQADAAQQSVKGRNFAFVFCDVTRSLTAGEVQRVGDLAVGVLQKLPPETEYSFYPLSDKAEWRPSITSGRVPLARTPKERADWGAEQSRLANKLGQASKPETSGESNPPTCIIETLNMVQGLLKQKSVKPEDWVDLVYISDMVEQCPKTRIDMGNPDISPGLRTAQGLKLDFDLSNLHVTVIFPLADDSKNNVANRPSWDDIQKFWRAVFSRCRVPDSQLKFIKDI
jgi:hypothetical protein